MIDVPEATPLPGGPLNAAPLESLSNPRREAPKPKINIPPELEATLHSTPGLIETYGENKQMKVLNPHTAVFLDNLAQIQEMAEFKVIADELIIERMAGSTQESSVETLQWKILNKVLARLGERIEMYKKGPVDPKSLPSQTDPINQLADMLANAMEQTEVQTQFESDRNTLDRLKSDFAPLNHLYRITRVDTKLTPPGIPVVEVDFEGTGIIQEGSNEKVNQSVTQLMVVQPEPIQAGIIDYARGLTQEQLTLFQRSAAHQTNAHIKEAVAQNYPDDEDLTDADMPTIVILPGIAQNETMWRPRIDFYRDEKHLNVKFMEYREFNPDMTFKEQADWLHDELMKDWDGKKPFAFEAHSWGGLVYWYFVNKYPEMASHCLLTASPTIADDDKYPSVLVSLMNYADTHPDQADWIIEHAPATGPLEGISLFKGMDPKQRREAWRIYLKHMGLPKQKQWDPLINEAPSIIPSVRGYGEKDTIPNMAGTGAARLGRNGLYIRNAEGTHDVIGDHESAYMAHRGMTADRIRNERLILSN